MCLPVAENAWKRRRSALPRCGSVWPWGAGEVGSPAIQAPHHLAHVRVRGRALRPMTRRWGSRIRVVLSALKPLMQASLEINFSALYK